MSRKRSARNLEPVRGPVAALGGLPVRIITEEEWQERRARRKSTLKLVDFDEIERLTFPNYFIAFFDYLATGEGRTKGVCVVRAHSADDLRRQVNLAWGAYFAQGCEVRQGTAPIPGYKTLIPDMARKVLKQLQQNAGRASPSNVAFSATVHVNYS